MRFWGDEFTAAETLQVKNSLRQIFTRIWEQRGRPASGLDLHFLALSGGGADGSFGAGLLNGWSQHGDRPEFVIVTGVSVGAIIAPFAFLGPEYDLPLRQLFTETSPDEIATSQPISALFGAISLADTQPLRHRLEKYIDHKMLAAIATQHDRGRRLLVATTNIDAARPVIWNLGAIARLGNLNLFIDVLLASSAVPGMFPPVPVEVETPSGHFVELHVDGGVTRSILIGPHGVEETWPRDLPFPMHMTVDIIQNTTLLPAYEPVKPSITAITERSISTMLRETGISELLNLSRIASATGNNFRMTFVPPGYGSTFASDFDSGQMQTLYQLGVNLAAQNGINWLNISPESIERTELEKYAKAALQAVESNQKMNAVK